MIQVLATGSGLSLQDGGRAGWRRFGVPSGGALDCVAMAAANRLLGNPLDAPVLEILQQGARLECACPMWVAAAGADSCGRLSSWTAREVAAGEVLEWDRVNPAMFAYLAVPGGFSADAYLGSVASDARNGMGRMIQRGDVLRVNASTVNRSTERVARRILNLDARWQDAGSLSFELFRGPQYDLFEPSERRKFIEQPWRVSARSDRTGYRLEGAAIAVPASITSEPVLPGSFQVPGSGEPIITMADGPTVGGYPKIAVLRERDLGRLAQCAPGTELHFSWVD